VASSNLVCMQYLSSSFYQMLFQVQSTSKSAKLATGAKPRLSILLRQPFTQLKSNTRRNINRYSRLDRALVNSQRTSNRKKKAGSLRGAVLNRVCQRCGQTMKRTSTCPTK
jgi:hypothetical protein